MRRLLPAVILAVALGSARAALPPADVSYVIITSSELAVAFEPLAAFKTRLGLPTRVVTLEWIAANVAPGADQPATIRAFLQEAYLDWGTRYVLLGGTVDAVPTRWVSSTFYPANGSTRIPADLYYAALDGDWDGDGDGILGEPWINAEDPGDAADLQPELALGRAPVTSAEEAALFVRKNLDFQILSGLPVPARALLEGEVVLPENYGPNSNYIILDGALHSEAIRSALEGATPSWQTARYYEYRAGWPGTLAPTGAAVLGAINTGGFRVVNFFFVSQYERTLRIGQDHVPYSALSQLTNQLPFFLGFTATDAAAPDATSPILTALLAQEGGCAGGIAFSRPAFPNTTPRYFEAFYRHAVAAPSTTVGDALVATLAELMANTQRNYVERWTHLTITLWADPTAPLQPIDMAVAVEDPGEGGHDDPVEDLPPRQPLLTAAPNPFNPQLEIRAELPAPARARLCVCDLRGGVVRELFAGSLPAGVSRWQWDGRDEMGRTAASGVYLLRLETDRRIVQRSVTLAR